MEKRSEEGFEQHSERGSGRFEEGETDRKEAPRKTLWLHKMPKLLLWRL